jgi:DNA-directed RNA polymerase specialized sigma24 family protein
MILKTVVREEAGLREIAKKLGIGYGTVHFRLRSAEISKSKAHERATRREA